ncbi:MAG: hypothetical protein CVU48_06945 [Candidatus Cloacimonetes bacterium HGW-Cloacimonetes-1]|nr:MAG: hypothetical protein CVU48_06945 [Candidatus Cloacimonetes bacterium HGW-Cloacimonetes-1]
MLQSLKILISGDFCPSMMPPPTSINPSSLIYSSDMMGMFADFNLKILNLECPLTNEVLPLDKTGPSLKASPLWGQRLCNSKIDLVSLSNNHILDFGQSGLSETVRVLQNNNIQYVGAGLSKQEASKPYHYSFNGMTVSILNFSEHEYASANSMYGGGNPIDPIDNEEVIRNESTLCDHVIVIVHGGSENISVPNPQYRKLLRFYARCGASLVVGHHSHVISGMELYKKVPIYYSLGNHYFPWTKQSAIEWNTGMSLIVTISKETLLCEHLFTQFNNENVEIIAKSTPLFLSVNNQFVANCNLVNNEEEFDNYWDTYFKKNYMSVVLKMFVANRYLRLLVRLRFIAVNRLIHKMSFLRYYHTLNCESASSIVVSMLEKYRNRFYR